MPINLFVKYGMVSTYTKARSTKDRQERFSFDTTLMCSRDLETFSLISYDGYHVDDIASRATPNPSHLSKLYNTYLGLIIQALKRVPYSPVMMCDIWIGKYGHHY